MWKVLLPSAHKFGMVFIPKFVTSHDPQLSPILVFLYFHKHPNPDLHITRSDGVGGILAFAMGFGDFLRSSGCGKFHMLTC